MTMQIEIAERLKPFSHLPGTFLMLPGTSCRLQIFPTFFKVEDLSGADPKPLISVKMNVQGPLDQFTIEQDLEKSLIRVWGRSPSGLLRYRLNGLANGLGLLLSMEKVPLEEVSFDCQGEWKAENLGPLKVGEQRIFGSAQRGSDFVICRTPLIDRLSLGNHKSQDWELVRRRKNFSEIFPVWHRLGQFLPKQNIETDVGTLSLLKECEQAIAEFLPEHILSHFTDLFLAGFEGILSPRSIDSDFQGIIPFQTGEHAYKTASPLPLLAYGSDLIRSLFVQVHQDMISLLPVCPPQFHCGRLIHVACGDLGMLSMEWTKKAVRCVGFIAASSQTIAISSRDGQRRCRMRSSFQDRGTSYQLGSKLDIIAGQHYWFDNFLS